MSNNKIKNHLKKQIARLKKFILLALVTPKNYQDVNMTMLKYFIKEKNIPCVYVTMNKPFSTIKDNLEKNGIDTEMMIFIDTVTNIAEGGEVEKSENCLFIEYPESLTDISIGISEAVNALQSEKKFLFFDPFSTLFVYNEAGSVLKFAHFLTGKIRQWNIDGILISLKRESDQKLIKELSEFCDLTIDFETLK